MNELFVVWAYRYGLSEIYNFPVGIFETLEQAENAADKHYNYKGWKYDHRIYQLPVGVEFDAEEAIRVRDFKKIKP